MSVARILARAKHFEGWRSGAYVDTTGHVTIGWGFNLGALVLPPHAGVRAEDIRIEPAQHLPEHLGEAWLTMLVAGVLDELGRRLPWFDKLDDVRREVLADLCYNMGVSKVLTFTNFLAQVERGEYVRASANMQSWKWAKDVGPRRADPLIEMMRTGVAQ